MERPWSGSGSPVGMAPLVVYEQISWRETVRSEEERLLEEARERFISWSLDIEKAGEEFQVCHMLLGAVLREVDRLSNVRECSICRGYHGPEIVHECE